MKNIFLVLILMIGLALDWKLLSYQSGNPVWLNRYSNVYFALILLYQCACACVTWCYFKKRKFLKMLCFVTLPSIVIIVAMLELSLQGLVHLGWISSLKGNVVNIYQATESNDPRPFQLTPSRVYREQTPEFFSEIPINEVGLPTSKSLSELLQAPRKVLVLGDSFTFGMGVKEGQRYCDALSTRLGPEWAIIPAGYASGYTPVDYEAYLRWAYPQYQPQLVVIGLFPFNDFEETLFRNLQKNKQGEIIASKLKNMQVVQGMIVNQSDPSQIELSFSKKIQVWVWKHCYIYRLLKFSFEGALRYWVIAKDTKRNGSKKEVSYLQGDLGDGHVQESLQALVRINQFLKERGSRLVVLHIPSNFQIHERYFNNMTLPGYGMSRQLMHQSKEQNQPQTALANWAKQNQISWVDPTASFRALEQEGTVLYFPVDAHWNKQGHQEAAAILGQFIQHNS